MESNTDKKTHLGQFKNTPLELVNCIIDLQNMGLLSFSNEDDKSYLTALKTVLEQQASTPQTGVEQIINRLQEQYAANGFECSPEIKLARIEENVSCIIKHWHGLYKAEVAKNSPGVDVGKVVEVINIGINKLKDITNYQGICTLRVSDLERCKLTLVKEIEALTVSSGVNTSDMLEEIETIIWANHDRAAPPAMQYDTIKHIIDFYFNGRVKPLHEKPKSNGKETTIS